MAVHSLRFLGQVHLRYQQQVRDLASSDSNFPSSKLGASLLEHFFTLHDWIRGRERNLNKEQVRLDIASRRHRWEPLQCMG